MADNSTSAGKDNSNRDAPSPFAPPQITLPKGGGAIRGIGEKFAANPVTGTGSLTVPIAVSPGRSGFGPQLSLSYDSGTGNGPFGMGWSLSLPAITRKTDKGLPQYRDSRHGGRDHEEHEESDVFILSGAEDLVPALHRDRRGKWVFDQHERDGYYVKRYRPRIEGLFARIERWTRLDDGDVHWRSISKDNILTVYGSDAQSRIADPENPRHVFSWLICRNFDDKGNAIVYEYAAENDEGVDLSRPNERHRRRTANRYLKRVKYGNRQPLLLDPDRPSFRKPHTAPLDLEGAGWMFEVVLDYGDEHYCEELADDDGRVFAQADLRERDDRCWPARKDPFSTYRSGFEVRTYRLCRRALMFHHFPDELGCDDYLVRSTAFEYHEKSIGSFITRVIQSGHKREDDGRYLTRSLPPLDLTYAASPLEDRDYRGYQLKEVDPDSLSNLPEGIDGSAYRFVDLDGEGISGVLAEQGDAWFYKPNLGEGHFGSTQAVATRPSLAALGGGRQQLLDVAGDGNLDLVDLAPPAPGFYERTLNAGWANFRPFRQLPVQDWNDPNLRFVDLTGDGIADVLITEDDAFTWHPSLLNEGFGEAVRVRIPSEEEKGPRVIFADGTQSIYLADMSGDGLSDLVRIRNGEVCYWPNRGYGRFGAKVTMDRSPWFDQPGLFNQQRVRLADTDGNGLTDILYLGRDGIRVFLNETGNGWSSARLLEDFPVTDNVAAVSVVDFLGRGTACLLWSSPLPGDSRRPLRYVDLMDGRKPHLLTRVTNNLGAETVVEYASSTEFYLADKAAGTRWVTRLTFPVHVVKRVETYDFVSRNRFVTRYSYHHGYYDGVEREFRGFGRVDQLDTEEFATLSKSGEFPVGDNIDAASSVPPVLTKTWFHTGIYIAGELISRHLAHEYYREGDRRNGEGELTDEELAAMLLDDTILPDHIGPEDAREACRALKGSMLRQEVYALDGTVESCRPYTVSESNYTIRPLQPRRMNRHGVFFTHAREAITFDCERNPADPRISHTLSLAFDDYGNVLTSVAIGYRRREPAFDAQSKTLATLTESQYTNATPEDDAYRTPLPAEAKTYELTAPALAGAKPLGFAKVASIAAAAIEIAYEVRPASGRIQKRLIARQRTLYRKNDLSGLLPRRTLESLALPGEKYKLAFTSGLLDTFQTKASPAELTAILAGPAAEYRDLDGAGPFWIPSCQVFYSPNSNDLPPHELAFARAHFFLPHRFADPFGNNTFVSYDKAYKLLQVFTRDAVGNETIAEPDYRVLQPKKVTDPNGNRTQLRFDVLGMLAGTALGGKAIGAVEGDSFDDFVTDPTPPQITEFFDAADPRAAAVARLGTATTRILYDLGRIPACAAAIARETHVSALAPGQQTKVQLHFVYSDGFGRETQTKAQAEPGPLDLDNPNSPVKNPRWIGTGATIYNNKGKPVRKYEPFFSATPRFRLERWGVSSTLFYDPLERVVATLHPNNTFEKVVFDPWRQTTFDVNDTVTSDPKNDPDVGEYFQRLPEADYLPTWYEQRINGAKGPEEQSAGEKAAKHANTPTIAHLDGLGRTFLTVADNGKDSNGIDQKFRTRTVLDIEGNQRAVVDALERTVARYDYDMLGTRIHQESMEAGERWMLNDVVGKPMRSWNSRAYAFRTEYDALHRPLKSFVQGGDPAEPNTQVFAQEILFERTIYGDSRDTELTELRQKQANMRGKVFRHFDTAGVVTTDLYDFKGNSLVSKRQFAADYRNTPDWARDTALEADTYSSATAFDALNRAIAVTAPDGSIYRPTFNDANLLETVDVNLYGAQKNGQPLWTRFVANIDYDAKSQRTLVQYANGVATIYSYDEETFRLMRHKTTRAAGQNGFAAQIFSDAATVQDLRYTYDPVGNITRIEDAALKRVFNANQQIESACGYTYDALYRLIEATGRENISQSNFALAPPDGNYRDYPFVGAAQQSDLQALRNYTERYDYDPVGNFQKMVHRAANGNWIRSYVYDERSLIEPSKISNRLSRTALQTKPMAPVEHYSYDQHGNVVRMPHLQLMQWNFNDELSATSRQRVNAGASATTCFVYDGSGQRARKITEGRDGERRHERLYLGGFEVHREYGAGGRIALERETLHVMDDKQRIALIETQTIDDGEAVTSRAPAHRYQLGNHLDSACLELDQAGGLISYEEYSPYGNSTYQAGRSPAEVSLKRYRYAGKERDRETGFAYHGARYYASWLGRWVSCDPLNPPDAGSLYVYGLRNPLRFVDPDGKADKDLVGNLLSKAEQLYSSAKVRIKTFAEEGEVAKYWKQGAARYADAVEEVGRLTEAEHPLAGEALKYLNPRFSYRAAKTIVVGRAVAIAKTVGDIRLIKAVKSGAMGAAEFAERSKANFVKAIATRWAQSGESSAATLIKEARQAAQVSEEAAKEALPVLSRSVAARTAQRGFSEVGLLSGIAGAGLSTVFGALSYKELKQDLKDKDYARALSSGAGVTASGTSLLASGASLVTGVTTSSVALGTSVGALSGAQAIAAAPHVVGAFAAGAAIGVGIQEGSAYLSKKYLGTEISPGQMIGDTLTAVDRTVSGVVADPNKPAYTQTLGWKIANWLTPTSN
jgi:RHS repeat-associated protein